MEWLYGIVGILFAHVIVFLLYMFLVLAPRYKAMYNGKSGPDPDEPKHPNDKQTEHEFAAEIVDVYKWIYLVLLILVSFLVEGWTPTIIIGVIFLALLIAKPIIFMHERWSTEESEKQLKALAKDLKDQGRDDEADWVLALAGDDVAMNPNLTRCPHCNNTVSVAATACPHCGCPFQP